VTAVLADEAVFMATRFVVPRVSPFLKQTEAFSLVHIVRFITVFSPVCVAYTAVFHISSIAHHFPYKLGPGFWVYALSSCPYVDSVRRMPSSAF